MQAEGRRDRPRVRRTRRAGPGTGRRPLAIGEAAPIVARSPCHVLDIRLLSARPAAPRARVQAQRGRRREARADVAAAAPALAVRFRKVTERKLAPTMERERHARGRRDERGRGARPGRRPRGRGRRGLAGQAGRRARAARSARPVAKLAAGDRGHRAGAREARHGARRAVRRRPRSPTCAPRRRRWTLAVADADRTR